MTGPDRPDWSAPGRRDADEIARILDHRARRAIAHMERLAWGKTPRTCPICGYLGPFSPVKLKAETWCPSCDSRPRRRLLKLWLEDIFNAKKGNPHPKAFPGAFGCPMARIPSTTTG